jgi:thiamine biosynthesis lipoprotein
MKPREFSPRGTITSVLVIGVLIAWTYIRQPVRQHVMFTGNTMGTTYEVKLPDANLKARGIRTLQSELETLLADINQQMSTYVPDSEISRFNQSTSTAPFKVSADFAQVLREALALSAETDGAFDPTVLPLVHLWGFGNTTNAPTPPSDEDLATARAMTGASKLRVPGPLAIQKTQPEVQLDLGAIAKGYAVDQLIKHLIKIDYTNYYVNIGGEIRTAGQSTNHSPWAIAIETPIPSDQQQLYEILELSNHAMATSGDYRNYYVGTDSNHYAHIIDPVTARPVTHKLASVSVIAPTCLQADALATALFVMGPERGIPWVNGHENIEAFFIVREGPDEFKHAATDGFKALIRQR